MTPSGVVSKKKNDINNEPKKLASESLSILQLSVKKVVKFFVYIALLKSKYKFIEANKHRTRYSTQKSNYQHDLLN